MLSASPTLTGTLTTAAISASGNVGIGATSPLAKNHTLGAGTAVVASGSDGAAEAIIEGANIAMTSSYGNLNVISNTAQAADTGGQIAFAGKSTDSSNVYATWGVIKGAKENATSANIASYLAFSTRANGAGNTEKLRITSAGKVGIGTTSPDLKMEIVDTSSGASKDGLLLTNYGGASNTETGIFFSPTEADGAIRGARISALNDGADDSNSVALKFSTGLGAPPVERMRITGAGKVGIGTTAPINNLQVHTSASSGGQIQIGNASTGATTGDGVVIGFDGSNDVIINNKEATQMKFYTSGTERMSISAAGNIVAPQIAKGWCSFNGTGTPALRAGSYNVASLTDNGTGDFDVVWATDFADDTYAASFTTNEEGGVAAFGMATQHATTDVRVRTATHAGTYVDQTYNSCIAFGAQ